MSTLAERFTINAPMMWVRRTHNAKPELVNEYTFRNLQIKVAEKVIRPFWYLSEGEIWRKCETNGYLPSGCPAFGINCKKGQNPLSIADELAIALFFRSPRPKFVPQSERK